MDEMAKEAEEIIRELPSAIVRWYDFQPGRSALYIGGADDAVFRMMKDELGLDAAAVTADDAAGVGGTYDYIVCVAAPERYENPAPFLATLKSRLADGGTLLLGMNNRLGIKYFCGDRDPYTGRNFDGIENYRLAYRNSADKFNGRMYSRAELSDMLSAAGFSFRFYSVAPDFSNPVFIYSEEYVPNEEFGNRVFPTYNYPQSVFLEEEPIYQTLYENGMFHQMADAYLIECRTDDAFSNVTHVTSSLERGRKRATLTIMRPDTVIKRAAFAEGTERIGALHDNLNYLKSRGIRVVDSEFDGRSLKMPYVKSETGQIYMKRFLLSGDIDGFIAAMDHFRELILASSETFEGVYEPAPYPGEEERKRPKPFTALLAKRAMLDMVPLNSFYDGEDFVFFDQEFSVENYPVNMIISRMVGSFYAGAIELSKMYPLENLLKRYGLMENRDMWNWLDSQFLAIIRKDMTLLKYHGKVRRDAEEMNANRQRVNYSVDDYQRIFMDIFEHADTRKLVLFGSGAYAERFAALYGTDYPVWAIVDNNTSRHGKELAGVKISPPDLLKSLRPGEFKVIICIKNYLSVMRQLEEIGIRDFGVFDPSRAYQRKRHPIPRPADSVKKYHVGYVAGVFDLFHIGHLNIFRRAKEQCDYLIVGVVSDEGVIKFKHTQPFMPFEERIALVRGCRYVDEAAEIPLYYGGTRDAWRMHHFDVQFSGSDYVNSPWWIEEKDFLERHGATLEFFPYTESTSSSKLKTLIEKKII